jgi:hypothetical protein
MRSQSFLLLYDFILAPLPFHIFFYLVLIQTNGTYTVSLGPEMSSPVPLLQFIVHVKYLDGTLAIQKPYYLRYGILWRNRNHQMYVVLLYIALQYLNLFPFAQLLYYFPNGPPELATQYLESIFWTPYDMVLTLPHRMC